MFIEIKDGLQIQVLIDGAGNQHQNLLILCLIKNTSDSELNSEIIMIHTTRNISEESRNLLKKEGVFSVNLKDDYGGLLTGVYDSFCYWGIVEDHNGFLVDSFRVGEHSIYHESYFTPEDFELLADYEICD